MRKAAVLPALASLPLGPQNSLDTLDANRIPRCVEITGVDYLKSPAATFAARG